MLDVLPSGLRKSARLTATTALAIILAACGGGGGGGSGLVSTPPPPPPPPTKTCPDGSVIPADQLCPTPPAPLQFPRIFPNITTNTEFAVLGLEANAFGGSASSLASNGFAVSYDAASDAYVIDLPSAGPGKFFSFSEDNSRWFGAITPIVGHDIQFAMFKPAPTNPELALAHTSFAHFELANYDYDLDPPFGFLAFGTPTPAGSVPTTGSATFDAIVRGLTLDTGNTIQGTAALRFNFEAGTLAGSLDPIFFSPNLPAAVPLGQYSFVNTVFGIGSTTFSGQLQHGSLAGLGAFNGLFTGPAAQELMAKWTAPYVNPETSQQSEMFGIWVGKKCC